MGELQDGAGAFARAERRRGRRGPRITTSNSPTALREVFSLPLGPNAGSRTNARTARRASRTVTSLGVGAADLLVGVDHDDSVAGGSQAELHAAPGARRASARGRPSCRRRPAREISSSTPAPASVARCRPARRCRSGRRATAAACVWRARPGAPPPGRRTARPRTPADGQAAHHELSCTSRSRTRAGRPGIVGRRLEGGQLLVSSATMRRSLLAKETEDRVRQREKPLRQRELSGLPECRRTGRG